MATACDATARRCALRVRCVILVFVTTHGVYTFYVIYDSNLITRRGADAGRL